MQTHSAYIGPDINSHSSQGMKEEMLDLHSKHSMAFRKHTGMNNGLVQPLTKSPTHRGSINDLGMCVHVCVSVYLCEYVSASIS